MRSPRPLPTILGALLTMLGLAVTVAAAGLLLAHATQRDGDGFYTSPAYDIDTTNTAVVTEVLDLGTHPGDWFPARGDLSFRVTVTPTGGEAVFTGIAPAHAVASLFEDVEHATITRFGDAPDGLRLLTHPGEQVAATPSSLGIWDASVEGTSTEVLTWDAEPGDWALVVMNADGTAGLDVTASAGVRTDLLLPIAVALAIGGLVVLAAGAALVLHEVTRRDPSDRRTVDAVVAGRSTPDAGRSVERANPVRLEATLDPELSRGLWLVKWFLAIPHLVVLWLLWIAFGLLTLVAGVAILFTGRYPRGIFEFNVGVLRWTWRVTDYAFGPLGTDRYPPFRLDPDPDYPATLDVAEPGELSRGLVLVKWWLLVLPHYLVVAVFTGGLFSWTTEVGAPGGAEAVVGGGLIGVLVVIAGVVLLFRGRYPTGIFDLVMGMQRWVYRVIAYAALMTDEYPPFRLDLGGSEPPVHAGPGPSAGGGDEGREQRELTHA